MRKECVPMKKFTIAIILAAILFAPFAHGEETYDELTSLTLDELSDLYQLIGAEIKARTIGDTPSPESDFLWVANDTEVYIRAYLGVGGDIAIPDEIDGKPVTQLCEKAFYEQNGITNLTLPRWLRKIERDCFRRSSINMKGTLVFPETLEYVGNAAFLDAFTDLTGIAIRSDCEFDGTLTMAWADTVEFFYIAADSNVKLCTNIFADCTALRVAVIPSSVTEISDSAFDMCPRLTIYTPEGSYAEAYAKRLMIPCDTQKYDVMDAYYASMYPSGT